MIARLAGLTVWVALTSVAHADAGSRLAPTPDALHREHAAALEQRLTRLLTALPEVERCELHLTLPFPFDEPLDAPPAAPRATVLLVGRPQREQVVRVLSAAVPNLAAEDITLIEQPSKAEPASISWVQVGPFLVHPSSAVGLRSWLTISLLANAVLAGLVLLRVRRA